MVRRSVLGTVHVMVGSPRDSLRDSLFLPEQETVHTSSCNLPEELDPVGTLEEFLAEKIAQEYWGLAVAAWYEAEDLSQGSPFKRTSIDRILRYQTTINRQLFQAMNQLERLRRLGKGRLSQRPLTLQVSTTPLPSPIRKTGKNDCAPLGTVAKVVGAKRFHNE